MIEGLNMNINTTKFPEFKIQFYHIKKFEVVTSIPTTKRKLNKLKISSFLDPSEN